MKWQQFPWGLPIQSSTDVNQSECPYDRHQTLYECVIIYFHILSDLYGRSSINNTITATMHSSVQFSMSAVISFPEAQFAWKVRKQGNHKLDEKIVDGESNGRLLISQSGDLYIAGVQREDTGTYTCVVSNPLIEEDITIEFVLTVLEGESS